MTQYCVKCCYTSVKPGFALDAEGKCSGCTAQEMKSQIDWDDRWNQLLTIRDTVVRDGAEYDCVIPVSGGKDSHLQVHLIKEKLGLRPLCINVAPLVETETGIANLRNLRERFDVDLVRLHPARETAKTLARWGFETMCWPSWSQDRAIYTWPIKFAARMGIKLVIMGENHDFEKGGADLGQGGDAVAQMMHSLGGDEIAKNIKELGLPEEHLQSYVPEDEQSLRASGMNVIWLGYYADWDSAAVAEKAKSLGFQGLGKNPPGRIEDYLGVDDGATPVSLWAKFIKYGVGPVTDTCFNHISYGRMTRAEARELILENDGILDPEARAAWQETLGVSDQLFDAVGEKFANRDVVYLDNGQWRVRRDFLN